MQSRVCKCEMWCVLLLAALVPALQPSPQNSSLPTSPAATSLQPTKKPPSEPARSLLSMPQEPKAPVETKTSNKPEVSPEVKVTHKPEPEVTNKSKLPESKMTSKPKIEPKVTNKPKAPEPKVTSKPKPPESKVTINKNKKLHEPKLSDKLKKFPGSKVIKNSKKIPESKFNKTKAATDAKLNKNKPKTIEVLKPAPKLAPIAKNKRRFDKKRVPLTESLVMAPRDINDNDLLDTRRAEGGDDRLLSAVKDKLQKDNEDYKEQVDQESEQRQSEQQSRRMQSARLDPALAVLLHNSQQEDERLQLQVGSALPHAIPRGEPVAQRRVPAENLPRFWPPPAHRLPQHLAYSQGLGPETPPQRLYNMLTTPSSKERQSRHKKYKLSKLVKFIKKNKGLLHDLIEEKRARGRGGGELRQGEDDRLLKLWPKEEKKPVMRVTEQLRGDQLDLVHARGSKISEMRLKGRICQRSVLKAEGPKYKSSGVAYESAYNETAKGHRFERTSAPKIVLPICCNCCVKSVLGCE